MPEAYEWRVLTDKKRKRPGHLFRRNDWDEHVLLWQSYCRKSDVHWGIDEGDPTIPMQTGHRSCQRCSRGMR